MISIRETGKIVAGELNSLIIPTDLNLQRPPLVDHHGAGGDGWASLGSDGYQGKIGCEAIASRGFVLTQCSQIALYGNDVCSTPVTGRTALAVAYARTKGAHPTKKAVLMGASMGSFATAKAIARDPNSYQCGVLFLPFMSLAMGIASNLIGLAAPIKAAYGMVGADPIPAGADLVGSTYIDALASVPLLFVYSSNDQVSFGPPGYEFDFFGFVDSVNGDLLNIGALGHTADWLLLTDSRLVAIADWIEEHVE